MGRFARSEADRVGKVSGLDGIRDRDGADGEVAVVVEEECEAVSHGQSRWYRCLLLVVGGSLIGEYMDSSPRFKLAEELNSYRI